VSIGLNVIAVLLGLGGAPIQPHPLQAQVSPASLQRSEQVEAETTLAASEAFYNQSKYPDAREQAVKALALCELLGDQRGVGRARHVLGLVASMMGEPADARVQFEAAIAAFEAAGDRRGRGKATLGLLPVGSLDGATTMQLLERTVSDARALGDKDLEARALHFWGDAVFHAGDNETALDKLEQAAQLFEATADALALGTVHNSLGRLYRRHGRVDLALDEQLTALSLHERFAATFEHLQSLNAVAVTYQAMGASREARAYFDRALNLAEQMASPRVQDFIRGNLATTLLDQGEHARAVRLLERLVANPIEISTGARYSALSRAYLAVGRLDQALDAAERALDLCATGTAISCVDAMRARANVRAARGDTAGALDDLRTAVDRIEALRERLVPADFLKQQFALPLEGIFSSAIALQFRQGQAVEALETAERARARAFVDLLAAKTVTVPRAGNSESTSTTPALAIADTPMATPPAAQWPLVLRGGNPPSGPDGVNPGPFDLANHGSAKAAGAADFTTLVTRLKSTMLVYWVADGELFIWVVRPQGTIRTARVPVREATLRELVRATLPFGSKGGPNSDKTGPRVTTRGDMTIALTRDQGTWRQLYDVVIRPVRHLLPQRAGALLTIVPHGPLAGLSFASLLNDRGRYLLEDYALHYVPAAGVLQFTVGNRQPDARAGSIMLVADPTLPPRSRLDQPLPSLPGARTEVRAIAGLLNGRQVTRLEGAAADEETVRRHAREKSVLHFATHAIVREDDPFGSFLALRPAATAAAADGYLSAREIYDLNLRSDLVVLSACRSGRGHITGDGIATFARAFLYAGAPTVITSLWDVADQPTNRLLPDFYRSWIGGQSKARALRAAALSLLRDLRAGRVEVPTSAGVVRVPEHPVFWAGFALIGEPD